MGEHRSPYRYIPCRCHCAEHFMRISRDDDLSDVLVVEIVSTKNGSIWHRLRWALKHVFGRDDLVLGDTLVSHAEWEAAGRDALSMEAAP